MQAHVLKMCAHVLSRLRAFSTRARTFMTVSTSGFFFSFSLTIFLTSFLIPGSPLQKDKGVGAKAIELLDRDIECFDAGAPGLDIGSELLADVLAVSVEYTFFLHT